MYQARTDAKQLAKWFPPEGFTATRCEVDPRPGGAFRVDMKAPDGPPFKGQVFPGPGLVRDVVPNERLVFTMQPELGDGQTMPVVLTTVRFEDQAGRTRLTVEQTLPSVADYQSMAKTGMAERLFGPSLLGMLVGREGIEPPQSKTADLHSAARGARNRRSSRPTFLDSEPRSQKSQPPSRVRESRG